MPLVAPSKEPQNPRIPHPEQNMESDLPQARCLVRRATWLANKDQVKSLSKDASVC